MKKKIILTIACMLMAANSYAATGAATGVPSGVSGFAPSTSVVVAYEGGPGAAGSTGNNTVYAISSKHQAGDEIYGTTNATTVLGKKAGTAGAELKTTDNPTLPASATDASLSGWTAM